jgi:hypothetical protein
MQNYTSKNHWQSSAHCTHVSHTSPLLILRNYQSRKSKDENRSTFKEFTLRSYRAKLEQFRTNVRQTETNERTTLSPMKAALRLTHFRQMSLVFLPSRPTAFSISFSISSFAEYMNFEFCWVTSLLGVLFSISLYRTPLKRLGLLLLLWVFALEVPSSTI